MATIPEALANALAHHRAGRQHEAEQIYRQILAVNPHDPNAWHLLGVIACETGRPDVAIEHIGRALALRSDFPDAHYNLGRALQQREQFDEAIHHYRLAIGLNPNYAEAHNNLGMVLLNQGLLDEAVNCYRRAAQLRPEYAAGHYGLGNALKDAGKTDQAIASFRRALELNPSSVDAHWNLSLMLLLKGDFVDGWREYEWRWKSGQLIELEFSQPRWDGKALGHRAVFLYCEQGFGDAIQFTRYAEVVKAQNPAATVIVGCKPPLANLLATCNGIDRIIAEGDQLPAFDVHCPLLSLPGILGTRMETIPANVPYLFANPKIIAKWRERLRNVSGFRIGINWQGRSGQGEFRKRDIPLGCFASLAQIPSVRLISLQKGADRAALEKVGIVEPGDDWDTTAGAFMDTAAIIKNVDLVITSDTSIPHLAGALGVPVWLALPFVPDWRWLLDRSDNPWYPTMRLFRQRAPGDWTAVFEEIRIELASMLTPNG